MAGPAVQLAPQPVVITPLRPRRAVSFLRANMVFRLVFALLALATMTAFLLNGVLAWTVGLIYIAYDSWLLWYMVRQSGRSVREAEYVTVPPYLSKSGKDKDGA